MKDRLPLLFILLTLMIDSMGIGLIMPVMPDLIREVRGGTLAEAALWGGLLTSSFAVMAFLFAPGLGNVSDRFGRRPVLLTALAVMALDYVVMALAGSIWLLLFGRIVGGITAGTQSTATAFIADISSAEEKAARFGLVGAAFGVGFVIGPLIGGLLAEFGTRAPFWAAAGLAAANLALGFFVLPETVTDRIRRPFEWSRANPFGAFRAVSRMPGVGRLVLIFLLYQVSFTVYPAVWAFFTAERFGWEPRVIGFSLAAFGVAIAVVQGGLIRFILKRLGDRGTVAYGMVFNTLGFFALVIMTDGTTAMILTPFLALGAVVTPALQGMMSRRIAENAQGELQGVLTSCAALAMIVSPPVMTGVFSAFTAPSAPVYLPGAPFVVSILLMGACAAVFLRTPRAAPA